MSAILVARISSLAITQPRYRQISNYRTSWDSLHSIQGHCRVHWDTESLAASSFSSDLALWCFLTNSAVIFRGGLGGRHPKGGSSNRKPPDKTFVCLLLLSEVYRPVSLFVSPYICLQLERCVYVCYLHFNKECHGDEPMTSFKIMSCRRLGDT